MKCKSWPGGGGGRTVFVVASSMLFLLQLARHHSLSNRQLPVRDVCYRSAKKLNILRMDATKRPLMIPPEFATYAEQHGIFDMYKVGFHLL